MGLAADVRLALRRLRREPALAAGIVLTFALAIGANATVLGLVERLMLSPPPGIRDAERVGLTFEGEEGGTYTVSTTSYPAFRAIAGAGAAFRDVAAERADTMTTGRGGDLAEVTVVQATGGYFAALGVRPEVGRLFGPADDEAPGGGDVVVLGHDYWRRVFAGDRDVVGRELVLSGRTFTVIGVAPRGFNGTGLAATDLFVPFSAAFRTQPAGWQSNPGMRVATVIARLRDGVSAEAAGQMSLSALRHEELGPVLRGLVSTPLESLVPGRSARESPRSRIAIWLWGVALVVLLIATANAGTLLMMRAARRRRDSAIRLALGASTARLVRQSLVECALLALAGAALGLLLSRWLAELVRVTLIPDLAAADRVADPNVLLASIAMACGAGLAAGLSPIARMRSRDLALDLHAGGHGSTGGFALQKLLVALQVALCMVLLVGAGLFVRSLQRVASQDLGFSTARLLHIELDHHGQLQGIERDRAHDDAVRRILAVPGVTGATVVQGMPFSSHHIPPISIPGFVFPPATARQLPILYGATPEYLSMMGIVRLEGRLLTDRDGRGTPLVVLVNETMARTIWPGRSALGKCVRAGHAGPPFDGDPEASAATLPCREVVGVVRDSRARSLRVEGGEDRLTQYYVPFAQLPPPPVPDPSSVHGILVRTADDPARLIEPIRRLVQATSQVPVYARVRPYQELLDPQLRSWRLGASLFSAFGALALAIASFGLFSVVSYLVTQRTREIGVRLALGATGKAVAGLVVRDALRMTAAGVAAGAVLSIAGAPLVQAMLFQTAPHDAASMLVAALLLAVVAVGAAALPAWRASRLSPMAVLRADG